MWIDLQPASLAAVRAPLPGSCPSGRCARTCASRRVVLVRLARLGARLVRGQADVRVRRADLSDPGLVENRDRHLRDARVVLADVADRVLVGDGRAGVLRALALVGRAGRRERVVEALVLDRVLADLAVGLLERQLGAVLDSPCPGHPRRPVPGGSSRSSGRYRDLVAAASAATDHRKRNSYGNKAAAHPAAAIRVARRVFPPPLYGVLLTGRDAIRPSWCQQSNPWRGRTGLRQNSFRCPPGARALPRKRNVERPRR